MAILGWLPTAQALEVTISAEYRGGGSGRFVNTTPPAALCRLWSGLCNGKSTVDVPIAYSKRSQQSAGDLRDRYYLKMPSRKQVEVFHELNGEMRRMNFDILSVSQQVHTPSNFSYSPLQGSVQGGCSNGSRLSSHAARTVTFHTYMRQPQAPEPCWASYSWAPVNHVDNSEVTQMGVSFLLDIPPPYRLAAGIYRGSLTYSIGPGGDFDFGSGVTALSGDSLTVNFVLDVQHAFIFEFPPGSERAVLEPKDGWQAWLGGAAAPSQVYRDLPFRLWSTGPFKVYKTCQYTLGDQCGIRNQHHDQVPVEIAMTLPAGILHQGRPVTRLSLPTGPAAALQFESMQPTLNRGGQLHFSVARNGVQAMLKQPGTTYSGEATVIFDAEL